MAVNEQTLESFVNTNLSILDEIVGTDASELKNILNSGTISAMETSEILNKLATASSASAQRALINTTLNTYSRVATNTMMKDAPSDTKYVYVGPIDEKTRDICLSMASSGRKTEAEIVSTFGSEVLVDGGGINCRHKWEIASDEGIKLFEGKQAQQVIQNKIVAPKPKIPKGFNVKYSGSEASLKKSFNDKIDDFSKGKTVTLYHGSNRKFDKFRIAKSRSDANAQFQGDGIFFTTDRMVAAKYATASRNANFEFGIIKELKRKNKNVGEIAERLYYKGDSIWQDKDTLRLVNLVEDSGVDANDIADLVEWIAGSKTEMSGGGGTAMTMFSNSTLSVPNHIVEIARKFGVKKNLLEPTIYEVKVTGKNILVTSSQQKAKSAFNNGYDAVIYTGSGTVDDVAEIIIYNEDNVSILNKSIIERVTVEEGWDGL
tara:strand:- start:770 stop:2065 length:1296 start_codon:yes stop_codon:yes gene_type:complete